MKLLFMLSFAIIVSSSRADVLPGLAVQKVELTGTDGQISIQRKDGQVWVADLDRKFERVEKLIDDNQLPRTFTVLCENVDRGVNVHFPVKLPLHLNSTNPEAIAASVGMSLINPPSLIFISGADVEYKAGAASLEPSSVAGQGTKEQVAKYINDQVMIEGNHNKNLDPQIDLSNYGALACDLYRGNAILHIWTRINLPRYQMESTETLSPSEIDGLYSSVKQKGSSTSPEVFAFRLYQAAKLNSGMDKISSLDIPTFSKFVDGIFDVNTGLLRNLSGDDLVSLASSIRKPDLTSSTMLIETLETANGK